MFGIHSAMADVAASPGNSGVMQNIKLHPRLVALSKFDPLTHLRMIFLAANMV